VVIEAAHSLNDNCHTSKVSVILIVLVCLHRVKTRLKIGLFGRTLIQGCIFIVTPGNEGSITSHAKLPDLTNRLVYRRFVVSSS